LALIAGRFFYYAPAGMTENLFPSSTIFIGYYSTACFMEDREELRKKIKETFRELERCTRTANERLRLFLNGLSVEEMIIKIKGLNFSDKSLNFLCEGIALEHEDYEICMAIEEIKKERATKQLALNETK
jgi:hypothetical protein